MAATRPTALPLATPSLAAVAESALAREARALQRLRAALARYALATADVDVLLADVRGLQRALGAQGELALRPRPAASTPARPRPTPSDTPRPRVVQTDWLADLETRRDAVAAYLFPAPR